MFTTTTWLELFLDRRGLRKPDGRPLFEYRVTQPEYAELRNLLLEIHPQLSHDCGAFCLYATEWWRRHGKGLTFDGLLDSLRLNAHYTQLYDQIETGLKYWARPLRIVRTPTRSRRDFVGSLSREGGLPLQTLLGSQGSVRQFFRRLLRAQLLGIEIDSNQAALAAGELPPAWRDPDIFNLAARLIHHVWELRAIVGNSSRPVADLDRLCPDWQQRLPIIVDNEVAAALVRGLVEDAQQIATTDHCGLDVQNRLISRDEQWYFQRVVELPPQVREREIWQLLDIAREAEDKPRRVQLFIDDGHGIHPLAIATQWRAAGPFELTPLVEGPFVTSSFTELVVHAEANAQTFSARLLPGGEALDTSPWVFIAESYEEGNSEWQLVAQGSAKVRASKALIAFDPKLEVSPEVDELFGILDMPSRRRTLIPVTTGRITLRDPESDQRFAIEVSSSVDDAHIYRVEGELFGEELRPPVWLGMPSIIEQPVFGVRREVRARELEWRPMHRSSPWQELSEACFGHVEVRLRRGDTTVFVKSLHIVPPTTNYEIRPTSDGAILALTGTTALHASVKSASGFAATRHAGSTGFEWAVSPGYEPPARLTLELGWVGDRHLALRLPFPNVGVRFIDRAGRVLPNNATVSLDRLSGCRVEAILPIGEFEPVVEGVLDQASDRNRNFVQESRFVHLLRRTRCRSATHQYRLDLSHLAQDVRLRLASSTDLNASVRLEVAVRNNKFRVIVRRFPISMRVNDSHTHVMVLHDKSETFVDFVVDRMTVCAVPIESPAAVPVLLSRATEGWRVDDIQSRTRTWLIYGVDGDRCCARPIIWTPLGDSSPPRDCLDDIVTLEQAVTLPWKPVRLTAILKVLDALIADPNHPEWRFLDSYLHSLGKLPSTVYDILDVLVKRPSLCVYTLLVSSPKPGFQTVWTALEELIFAWRLVPVRAWIAGFKLWWAQTEAGIATSSEAMRGAVLHSAQAHARSNLAWIETRLRGFTVVRELIEQALFDAEPGQYTSAVSHPSGFGRQAMRQTRDVAHMGLHRTHANERWPYFRAIHELAHRFPDLRPSSMAPLEQLGHPVRDNLLCVSYAPIQAAIVAACDIPLTPEQLFAIRQLETFDNTWFDTCYETTLAAAVGVLLQDDPEAFR